MPGRARPETPRRWLADHAADGCVGLFVAAWLVYAARVTRDVYLWSDDLPLLVQAGSWRGLIEPYNGHMSVVILSIYRASAEITGLSYDLIRAAGLLSLLAVPITYYATTRRRLGPWIAALLTMPLLWHDGMNLRPAALNHYLALVGGVICAAALNRGRRADWVLAAGLGLALGSAGGGLVVASACVIHSICVRPAARRWVAIVVPIALWAAWWLTIGDATFVTARFPLGGLDALKVVRDLCLSPFYSAGFGVTAIAILLMAAFCAFAVTQLRAGLAASANLLAWTTAMILWGLALVRTRGIFADPQTFRYAYLSMGFALLAVVPHQSARWPARAPFNRTATVAVATLALLGLGVVAGLSVRGDLQRFRQLEARGRTAKAMVMAVELGPDVVRDPTPLPFFGLFEPHGTAGELRELMRRYGPAEDDITEATIDRRLVDLGVVQTSAGSRRPHPRCLPLSKETKTAPGGTIRLWSPKSYVVEVRRFGDDWVRLLDVSAGTNVAITLPDLGAKEPWRVRATGACAFQPRP